MGAIELDAVKLAKQLYNNQNYQACELILHEHLRANRTDIEALGLMANNYEKTYRYDLALQIYRSAVKIAQAVGEDSRDLQLSSQRLEAKICVIDTDGKSTEQLRNEYLQEREDSKPDAKHRSVVENMCRRISPYFNFPEIESENRTRNNYGYEIKDGFRGKTYPFIPETRSEEFVVGIFGGAVASAFYQDSAGLLADRLSAHTCIKGHKVTVLNYAMGGVKQPEPMISFAYFTGIGHNFDLIINIDGRNDLAGFRGNLFSGHHMAMPLSNLTNAFLALTGVADLDMNSLKYYSKLSQVQRWIDRFEKKKWPFNLTPIFLNALQKKRQCQVYEKPASRNSRNLLHIQSTQPVNVYELGDEEYDQVLDEFGKFWINCIRNMIFICEGKKVQYVHALHPTHHLMHRPLGPVDAKLAECANVEVYKRLIERGFPIFLVYANAISESILVHFCSFSGLLEYQGDEMLSDAIAHFNPKVHKAMAEKLASLIETNTPT